MAIRRLNPEIFVHFQDPESGVKEYADSAQQLPVGIRINSPGSAGAKKVEQQIMQANLDRQSKKMSAVQLEQAVMARLACNTLEFVNFTAVPGYEELNNAKDPKDLQEGARRFYADPDYAHLREQVQENLGDFSASLSTQPNS